MQHIRLFILYILYISMLYVYFFHSFFSLLSIYSVCIQRYAIDRKYLQRKISMLFWESDTNGPNETK